MSDQSTSISELEKRMRPGAWSRGGFLGSDESLLAVCEQDCQALQAAQVTFSQVADALEQILQQALDQHHELLTRRESTLARQEGKLKTALQLALQTAPGAVLFAQRDLHLPNLLTGLLPGFSLQNPPDLETGYWVDGTWQVFFAMYRGKQDCPWGCPLDPWAHFDFLIFHRLTGEFITGPGLIIHLIRAHQFFEGPESPYRLDPARAVRVLGLGPGNSTG